MRGRVQIDKLKNIVLAYEEYDPLILRLHGFEDEKAILSFEPKQNKLEDVKLRRLKIKKNKKGSYVNIDGKTVYIYNFMGGFKINII